MGLRSFSKKLNRAADLIIEGYRNGATLRELAKIHDCSIGTIRNLLMERNEPRRPRGRRLGDGKT